MKKVFILTLFLFTIFWGYTQKNHLHLNHLTVEDGLPANVPLTLAQDNQGYMWIGTPDGLVRYDGYQVKVYKPATEKTRNSRLNIIHFLFVDHKGVLWMVVGDDGFYRYNRETDDFTVFRPATTAIHYGTFHNTFSIKEDSQNRLWIMNPLFHRGYQIDQFNTETGKFLTFGTDSAAANKIPVNDIGNLIVDKSGRVWIGTDNGIYVFDEAAKKFNGYLTSSDSLANRGFDPIYEAPSEPGILWMNPGNEKKNTANGLMRFDTQSGQIKQYLHKLSDPNSISSNTIYLIFEDSKRRMWIETDKSLSLFERETERFTNYFPNDSVNGLHGGFYVLKEDYHGGLWMINNKELSFFDPEKKIFIDYTTDQSKSAGVFRDIFIDKTNNIWLSFSIRSGLYWINQSSLKFNRYQNIPGDPTSYPGGATNSVASDGNGNYWLGTSSGLYNWNRKTDQFKKIVIDKNPIENNREIIAVKLDKEGVIWAGTRKYGLFSYNPKTQVYKNYNHRDGDTTSLSSYNYIWTINVDRTGDIWIATDKGLDKLDGRSGKFQHYHFFEEKGFPDRVRSIYEDRGGVLWLGASSGSLNRFDREKETFTAFPPSKADSKSEEEDMHEDKLGQFWYASSAGVVLFDRSTGKRRFFGEENGLLYNFTLRLNEDREGFLWITSERGLSRLDTKNFTFTNYTTAQGLPENINALASKPYLMENGDMLIGTETGFFTFSPEMISPEYRSHNSVAPFMNIEAINYMDSWASKNGKEDTLLIVDDRKDKLDLPYYENRISFHYTGVHYSNSELIQYAYKLAGYDNNWVHAGTQRTVTYTNLPTGTYTFMVKSANSDGVWNEKPASFIVIIHPPWWRTWWAYILFALVFAGIIWAFIYYRSLSLLREKRILEQKVDSRTAEVIKQKEEIQNNLKELQVTQAQLIQSEKMASLGEMTAGIAHEIQNPLNFMNNFSEVNKELIQEMQDELKMGNNKEAIAISNSIKENEDKINNHGKRADAIIKGMLQHSRISTGIKEPTNINALADEYLRLAYYGIRAKDKDFNCTIKTDFNPTIGVINIIPQDIGRVLLNLYNNAFYAVAEKKRLQPEGYEPVVFVNTKKTGNDIEIRVQDNANGIPQKVIDKIFQPFFTTKPAGQGTGLGLSLSYDIVKAHRGEIKVDTNEGVFTEFIITLPV